MLYKTSRDILYTPALSSSGSEERTGYRGRQWTWKNRRSSVRGGGDAAGKIVDLLYVRSLASRARLDICGGRDTRKRVWRALEEQQPATEQSPGQTGGGTGAARGRTAAALSGLGRTQAAGGAGAAGSGTDAQYDPPHFAAARSGAGSRAPPTSDGAIPARKTPNELWQMDFKSPKGWNAAVGPLSVIDDCSRYVLVLQGRCRATTANAGAGATGVPPLPVAACRKRC